MLRVSIRSLLCGVVCILLAVCVAAQESPQRDPQAILLLTKAVSVMGGNAPSSSLAEGTVELVEGSTREMRRIRIITRGLDESVEEIQTGKELRASIYSRGRLAKKFDSDLQQLNLEMAATGQSPSFPLALIAGALTNPDFAFEYMGLESSEGVLAHHIRFKNTYASKPQLKKLTEASVRDLWLDAATGLPRRIFYNQHWGRGGAPRIPVETFLSDYRDVGGVLYPFSIRRSLNGTPWATIQIYNVVLNAGVSDADFQTR